MTRESITLHLLGHALSGAGLTMRASRLGKDWEVTLICPERVYSGVSWSLQHAFWAAWAEFEKTEVEP